MFCYKITIEYNGRDFYGWQQQPKLRTVQAALIEAISTVVQQPVLNLHASGRTDAGVHAKGQVVSFQLENEFATAKLKLAVSSLLRGEIAILEARQMSSPDFHARYDAKEKTYQYYLLNRVAPPTYNQNLWHYPKEIDRDLLRHLLSGLIGEHNFKSFSATDCVTHSYLRTILRSELSVDGNIYCIELAGNGFLKQMVRNLVGTLVGLSGSGQSRPETTDKLAEIFARQDRRAAGVTAPACGLFLKSVGYD